MENQSLELTLKSNFCLSFNLNGALAFDAVPKKYVDLMDHPLIQEYFDLAEKLKSDAILFVEEEFKKIEQIKTAINEVNKSFDQLSQNLNNRVKISKIQLLQNIEDSEVEILELNRLNELLWFVLAYKINLEWRIDELGCFRRLNHDFNKENLLKYFELVDKELGAEHTAQVYERLVPYLDYEVLETGDVVLSINPNVNQLLVNDIGSSVSRCMEKNFITKHHDFNWLVNFILFNCNDYRFSSDRLSEVNYKIISDQPSKNDQESTKDKKLEKYGLELSTAERGYKIKISKDHLPFLEQQIGFKVVNKPQEKTFKNMVLSFFNRK